MRQFIRARHGPGWPVIFGSLTAILWASPLTGVAQSVGPAAPTASEYLNRALDLMQQHSINARKVDWMSLRRETLAHGAGAQTTYDTYDAIRFALQGLNDHHSFLQLSDALVQQDKESHARRGVAPIQPGGSEKWPPSPYVERRTPEGEMTIMGGVRIAWIVVPLSGGGDDARMQSYAKALQTHIETLATQNAQAWIIDLRGNLGGNMWPMLAGIAPLLDTTDVGSFVDANGNKTTWFVSAEGAGLQKPNGGPEVLCRLPKRSLSFRKPPVIAVLIDHGTASSGEAVSIALRGQRRTRFFGRATHGQTTSNEGFRLSDGANLVLATGIEADRTGQLYPSGMVPDVELPEQADRPTSPDSDPMIRSAAEWIRTMAQNQL